MATKQQSAVISLVPLLLSTVMVTELPLVAGPGDLGIGEAIDTSFAVALGDGIADIIIFDWKEVGHHFNNG